MKASTKLLPLLVFVLFLFGCKKQKSVSESETLHNQIDSILMTVPDFSGVVLVASKGESIYHKAFGYQNFETKIPLDTTDIFELASVSKQFTAMIIMILKEEGKLSYDDLLETYLPGLPYPNITIRHLLTHTSGLPDYQAIMDQHWDKSKVAGNEDILTYLKKYQPPTLFQPGEKYEYSNTGYVLLGSIAEKASGKDFISLCRERIFSPLRMQSTDIRSLEEKKAIKNFALGHIFVEEKQRYVRADSFPSSNYTIWLGNRKGPGRISSTSTDLLLWDRALYKDNLVSNQTLMEAFTPMKLTNDSLSYYGFGWMLKKNNLKIVFHTGDNPGYKTKIVRFTNQDKTLIILCNNAHTKFATIADSLETLLSN
jgi:CubicO group peptidase (beta-lactamase class C family)